MGDIEVAVKGAQQLEMLLEDRFGATGRGLHEKVSSVESRLAGDLVGKIRWIATLRNHVVHEAAQVPDLAAFEQAIVECSERLRTFSPPTNTGSPIVRKVRPPARSMVIPLLVTAAVFGVGGWLLGRGQGFAARAGTTTPATIAAATNTNAGADAVASVSGSDGVKSTQASGAAKASVNLPGSLAELGKQATNDAAQGRKDIDDLWQVIATGTQVSLGAPQIKDNGNGTNDVLVDVTWQLDPKPVLAVLNKYFWEYKHEPLKSGDVDFSGHMRGNARGIVVRDTWNTVQDQRTPFSVDLLHYVTQKQARIRVSAGKRSGSITIVAGRKCFVVCEGFGSDQFQIHLDNRKDPKKVMLSSYRGDENPVRIAGVPTAELGEITNISASVEIVSAARE
ncbi:hypothetical protein WME99_47570 [Sorangium sp. So ce136]|uniref:hypothetical protein n=1 Tax=Sorangium sp. So ce136 TaxID=3133284 RepID=UPI003F02D732